MNKISILLIALLTIACGSKKSFIETDKTSREMNIDGRSIDWQRQTTFQLKDELRYAVMHDDEDVYVILETDNQNDMIKMAMFGLNIWWNGKGDKKKTQGIRFPVGMDQDEFKSRMRNNQGQPQEADRRDMMMRMREQNMNEIILLNFEGSDELLFDKNAAQSMHGIEVDAGFLPTGFFGVELRIPKDLIAESVGDKGDEIAIGFFTEPFDAPEMPSGTRMNRARAMGALTPEMEARMNRMQELSRPIKFWDFFDISD